MELNYLKKEIKVLERSIFKSLNIYEEENEIPSHNGRASKKVEVRHPLPFASYVDGVVKNIEGLISSLIFETDKDIIMGLSEVQHSLLSIQNIEGKDYYLDLRKKIFKNLETINNLESLIEGK